MLQIQENIKKKYSVQKKEVNQYNYESSGEEHSDDELVPNEQEKQKGFLDPLVYQTKNGEKQLSSFANSKDHDMSALSEDMSFLNLMEANEEDENHKPIAFDKGSKLEAYLGGGCCMFVFVLSSILWIILFRSLALKNARVRELVYDIPTLGIYHDKYNDFFHLYDQERDRVLAANTVL